MGGAAASRTHPLGEPGVEARPRFWVLGQGGVGCLLSGTGGR